MIPTNPSHPSKLQTAYSLTFLLLMSLVMYGPVLFASGDHILSKAGTDTWSQYIYMRDFGFRHLREGFLPLWNPHLFSGMPFFGGMQSALLYPLNGLFLFLSLTQAINISIIIHVFLLGTFMYLWVASRGLHPLACLLSALLLMFSSPVVMHIYAGHLTDLCTMAWAPLLFLCVDKLFYRPSLFWLLLGLFVASMQILAGHPQYLYYTAIAAVIYTILCMMKAGWNWRSPCLIAAIYPGAAALCAIQLLTGMEAASEGVRSGGTSHIFAAMFSFPPENLITLVAPFFYGNLTAIPYWGRYYPWAMTLYIGVAGLFLALLGTFRGDKTIRRYSSVMTLVLLLLALGANTPLFTLFYEYVPGFNTFRGTSKFIFPAVIFLTMLSGIGLHELIQGKPLATKTALGVAVFACLIFGAAYWLFSSSTAPATNNTWPRLMAFIASTQASYLDPRLYFQQDFIIEAGQYAAKTLALSGVICLFITLLLMMRPYFHWAPYLVALLAVCDLFIFAVSLRVDFHIKQTNAPEIRHFLQTHPGDHRILNLVTPNSAMILGQQDIWGLDPGVSLRYARFIAHTQGQDPANTANYVVFRQYHKFFRMLRLRYAVFPEGQIIKIEEYKDHLPRLQLIRDVRVLSNIKAILSEMEKDSFDPYHTVFLENLPTIRPSPAGIPGTCDFQQTTTDEWTIRVQAHADSILLITDNYSKGWRAMALPGSSQRDYRIMPANVTLMAIPLSAGIHHLKMEYAPMSFRLGKWISLVSLIAYLAGLLYAFRKRKEASGGLSVKG